MAKRKVANPLALAVLGLLQEQPMHPYEIATTLRERNKDTSFKITTGSLYDTVESLAKHEWIEPVQTVRDGKRPERTVYAHTELGRTEFVAWLDELIRVPQPEYPKFIAAVSYLGALGRAGALDALSERAGHLAEQVDKTTTVLNDTVGAGKAPRLFMIEVEYALHALTAELEWTNNTVDEIRAGTLYWPQVERTKNGWTWTTPLEEEK